MATVLSKRQTVHEVGECAPAKVIRITVLQRYDTIIDNNPDKLLSHTIACHLLEVGSRGKWHRPAYAVASGLRRSLDGRVRQRSCGIVQPQRAEYAGQVATQSVN